MPPRSLPRRALLGIGRRHRLCQGDGEIHGKGGPLPQMALHGDGAAHGVDEALDDGESPRPVPLMLPLSWECSWEKGA